MAISTFPPVSGGGGGAGESTWYKLTTLNTNYKPSYPWENAVYEFVAWAEDLNSTPIVTITFLDINGDPVGSTIATKDDMTSETTNPSRLIYNLDTTTIKSMAFRSSVNNTLLQISRIADPYVTLGSLVTTYTTSGTISPSTAVKVVAIGGGGGGGSLVSYSSGSGGGSGYYQLINRSAGTYNFTIGAGGLNGQQGIRAPGAGGATVFDGVTANGGGAGANGGNPGGNGGSGGGGNNGGSGGTNGASGNGSGGTGSGTALPWFIAPGTGGTGGNANQGGQGGGLYAGGGGGGNASGNSGASTGGSGSVGGGGGGGGAGANNNTGAFGGSGGAGAIYVLGV